MKIHILFNGDKSAVVETDSRLCVKKDSAQVLEVITTYPGNLDSITILNMYVIVERVLTYFCFNSQNIPSFRVILSEYKPR